MHVVSVTATCGRHVLLERSVRFFLEQDYQGPHTLLIYNNSPVAQTLAEILLPPNKKILLLNNHIDSETKEPYTNLGAIYNDILLLIPQGCEVLNYQDDDDIFLPNHISEGVKGLLEGGKKAYKPQYSWYRHAQGIAKMDNTLEPSIFVYVDHVKHYKHSHTTTQQHLQWVDPLVYGKQIFIKKDGISTLIYNWGDTDIFTYKTSGRYDLPTNFFDCRTYSTDQGDGVITPWRREDVLQYYKQIENAQRSPNKKSQRSRH